MSATLSEFVQNFAFDKPIHRLIMLKILTSGAPDGNEERVIDHNAMTRFCCCTEQLLFRELKELERGGYLRVRRIASQVTDDGKVRILPARAYTILPAVSK